MENRRFVLLRAIGWTAGGFGVGQAFRLLTSIILARLLAPEIFGVMLIVNSVRTGVDLISDVGINQNIVQNKNSENPAFYNTAWTLQVIRGLLLWAICAAIAIPVANVYQAPILIFALPIAALYFVFEGSSSISAFILQKRLSLRKLNLYLVVIDAISACAHVLLAVVSPTIWALVLGVLVASASKSIGTHFLVSDISCRFFLSKAYCYQIFSFGKWIFLSSIVYFASTNFDRLYLGTAMPFAVLGIYGIARSLADLIVALVVRLCSFVVFPFIASSTQVPPEQLRQRLKPKRLRILLLASLGLSVFAAVADLPIKILYDDRYQAAGWMLPIMTIGIWFSILCSINETTLLGLGKPNYGAVGNCFRFAYLLIALPNGFKHYGIAGVVIVVSLADLCRYLPIMIGQIHVRLSFFIQDSCLTVTTFLSIAFWVWLRWMLGFGTSFSSLL
jgi:O-antigen/teichoic acid export membrane protein